MVELLQALANNFTTTPMISSREMRRRFEADSLGFTDAAVALLRSGQFNSGCQYALTLLVANDLILKRLTDPRCLSVREAVEIARLVQGNVDSFVDVKLTRFLLPSNGMAPVVTDSVCVLRTLEVIGAISDGSRVITLLTQLLSHSDIRIRSKVALLIGRINHNLKWVAQRLRDPDRRVRANAVESLWGLDTEEAGRVFREICHDPDNRVACNAAVGLYLAGDSYGAEALLEMLGRPDAGFRISAIWGMGETGDPRFLPTLSGELAATSPELRPRIFQAISKIRRRCKEAREAGALQVLITGAQVDDDLRRLTVAIHRGSGQPVTGLGPLNLVISDGGVILHDAQMKELPAPENTVTGFVFPRFADAADPFQVSILEGMKEFVTQKRRQDRWGALQYYTEPPGPDIALDLSRSLLASGSGAAAAITEQKTESDTDQLVFSQDPAPILRACQSKGSRSAAAAGISEAIRRMIIAMAMTRGQKFIYLFVVDSGFVPSDELCRLAEDSRVAIRALTLGGQPSGGLMRLCTDSGGAAANVPAPADMNVAATRAAAAVNSSCEVEYRIPKGSKGEIKIQVQTPVGYGEDTFVCE